MIRPWQIIQTKPLGNFHIFKLRSDEKISPRNGLSHNFFVIDCVDWVNVVAVTPDEELVMVEQYRHGSDTVELEIPGGTMDAKDSSPVGTGVRELREETGYEGERARSIGQIFPNPAIMSNKCYTVLVENCQLKHPTELDSGEDLVTQLVPLKEVPKLVSSGKIRHALVVVALYHFELLKRGS